MRQGWEKRERGRGGEYKKEIDKEKRNDMEKGKVYVRERDREVGVREEEKESYK